MGQVQVPELAYYGAQTARAVENFPISGRRADPALIRAYIRIKKAAAIANRKSGAISPRDSRLIVAAADELLRMKDADLAEHFPVDVYQAGAGTSQNMNTNEVIANLANRKAGKDLGSYNPIHPNDHVNRSQSTNDTFPTAMRLALLDASRTLGPELLKTSRTLSRHARDWKQIPKSARTHLQDAVPIRLGQEIGAYALTLRRCAERIERARDELRELGLGGTAAGTGLTAPAGYATAAVRELSRMTGERLREAEDLREAMQSQAPVIAYSGALRLLALELTRICNDLRLLASGPLTGLAEIQLPSVQPGSSIMPGKVNPSILEMANQAMYSVLGMDHTAAMCAQAGQLELNVMMPILASTLIDATRVMNSTLRVLRERCLEGITPNERRLTKYFESTPQVATALSPLLGYDKVASLVKRALKEDRSVIEIVRKEKLIPEAQLARLLDLRALTSPSKGSSVVAKSAQAPNSAGRGMDGKRRKAVRRGKRAR